MGLGGTDVKRALATLATAALLAMGAPAMGLTGDELDYPTGHSVRVHHDRPGPGAVSAFARRSELEQFQTRHGGRWEAYWDALTNTPVSMWGSGIQVLAPDESRSAEVVRASLEFVASNPGLFQVGAQELILDYAYPNQDLWYVNFRRSFEGVPVHQSNVAFRYKAGRLILLSAETYADAQVDIQPRITASQALDIAASEVAFAHGLDAVARQPQLWVYPEVGASAIGYRLAWRFETRNTAPDGWFGYFVDAHDGDLLEVFRLDPRGYSGSVVVDVDERTVGSPIVRVPGAFDRITVTGAGTVDSDQDGQFSIASGTGNRSITAQLRGKYVTVTNSGGTTASFSGTITDSAPFQLLWSANADASERDTFHAVNRTNRFVASVFPNVAWIGTALQARVNLTQTCNAYWNGSSINFFRSGGGCNATGRIFDVVAHEWGHALDQFAPGNAQDGGLGEFIGDLVSMTQTRDYRMGPGFFTDGRPVRDMEDPAFNCYDPGKTEVHAAGQLLGAVVYDIMNDLDRVGLTGEAQKRLLLLPIAGAQTRNRWYDEMRIADDDDGNLANGTPNECLIYNQFNLHSCGTTRWPGIPPGEPATCYFGAHTPFAATDVPKPIPDNDAAGASSSMSVSANLTIADLDVDLKIDHTAIGDLKLTLSHTSTDTVKVVLHDRTGGEQDNIHANYDRTSPSKEPLAAFNGRNVQGTWNLEAIDSRTGNTGAVKSWSIHVRPSN